MTDYRPKRRMSPLQQKRAQCLSEQMKGRTFSGREDQKRAFANAVQTCKQKYPKV